MKKLSNKGFTLIEVVIVLAIAALIMVIVFLAVQGANRAQRDTARKTTANQILAATQQYAGNNSGDMPSVPNDLASYFSTPPSDPQTGTYVVAAFSSGTADSTTRLIMSPGTCNGSAVDADPTARTFAVSIYQENGGAYCISDSQ
jgi:prepilin-type N-terminal cleavage/methylation domain-containing protein